MSEKSNLSELDPSDLICVKKHACSDAGIKCGVVALSLTEMVGVKIQERSNCMFLSWIDISPGQMKTGFWGHVPRNVAEILMEGGHVEVPKEVFYYAKGHPNHMKDPAVTERILREMYIEEQMSDFFAT